MNRAVTLLILAVSIIMACSSGDATTGPATPPGADAANVDEESIYEVDAEDPYKIFNGTFMDFAPGQPILSGSKRLSKSKLRTGEGKFEVYYLRSDAGEQLGYLVPEPQDQSKIGSIHITSPEVVTQLGFRVGNTFAELTERLGLMEVHGSEIEGYTDAYGEGLRFRLDESHMDYNLKASDISPSARVTQIIIPRK